METRKLQKIGGSTYSVSLPKEWATEHHLEAGMPIHLFPHTDGSLVVRHATQDGGPLSATTVSLPAADADTADQGSTSGRSRTDEMERVVRAAYAVGYDTVTLVAPEDAPLTAEERRAVRLPVQTMVGMSVVEETPERITVENLLDASEVSMRQSVIQLQFTTLSMHRAAVERLRRRVKDDTVETDPLDERDDEVDRLFEMITRHFNRSLTDLAEIDDLDVRRPELFDYYLVARQLERIADHAVRIGSLADHADPDIDDEMLAEVVTLAEAAREVVETATTAVVEASADRAHEALDRRNRVVDDVRALDRALFERAPPGAYALSRVLASITRTAEYGGNVARIALRASVRPEV